MQTAQEPLPAPVELDAQGWGYRWLLGVGVIAMVIGFFALGLGRFFSFDEIRSNLDIYQAQVQANLLLAALAFFAVYALITAFSLPVATMLTLLAGALFGRLFGACIVLTAATVGATLAFCTSRYLFRDWVQQRLGGHLESLNQGIEKDGAYYLFTLRLVPIFPFFLINLGMGLTPISLQTYVWVSLLGMLPGSLLYANAGRALATLDSPSDLLSTGVIVSLVLLGVAPLAFRKLVQWELRPRTWAIALIVVLLAVLIGAGGRTYFRYRTDPVMTVPIREYSNHEYSDDPAQRSVHFGKYDGRQLSLEQKDETHFDFVFTSPHAHVARVAFRNVDVSLMTPGLPEWTKSDPGLRRIALTDRQWNRQQVRFDPASPQVEIEGGDGFEKKRLFSAELAKNCLNAGLWEILLFVEEDGKKALYYHGWFTFPLGHYKGIFEHNTGLAYWQHWHYLEHWVDPAGIALGMDDLRTVQRERAVDVTDLVDEPIFAAGEQRGKTRIMLAPNVIRWKDFSDGRKIRFATFLPPGRYSVNHPWKNEFWRLERLDKAIWRDIRSPAGKLHLHELEFVFESSKLAGQCRFLIGGVNLAELPKLAPVDYPKGLYMPMGIGIPPFAQSYADLQKHPPHRSPFYCLMLDEADRWINHHEVAVDGPVAHRDRDDPERLHVYLLSYERHTLLKHLIVRLPGLAGQTQNEVALSKAR
ncbi:MAG: TVP38/TMEM64 family protein [Planctomycetes bacterium]|nr:TVP38/TMEM64 family protein [Planctomycetota bacterium]